MVLFRYFSISLVFLFGLSSCLNKYKDFDIESNTQIIAPIAHGSFLLGELLENFNEDSIFQNGEENELIISYREDGIEQLFINELISFPSSYDLATGSKALDQIALDDTTYYKLISLSELVEKLADNDSVPEFSAGEQIVFPEINLGNEVSMFLTWEIADLNFIHNVTFTDGEIECSLTNNFPTTCKVEVMLFDSAGNIIDIMSFNGDSGSGMLPGQTQVKTKNMERKSIKPPLYFNISSLHFYESPNAVTIDLNKGFDLFITLHDMKISEGNIRSDHLRYISQPQQINVDLANGAELTKVIIETAKLNVQFQKMFNLTGTLSIFFPNLTKNGIPYSFAIPITDNSIVSQNYNLDGAELSLSSGVADYNSLEYYFEFVSTGNAFVDIKSTDQFQYNIDIYDMNYSYLEGYFGNRKIDISKSNFTLNPEIWEKYTGEIIGNNTKLTLYFNNPFGIPIKCSMGIKAFNQMGDSVNMSYPNFPLPYPRNFSEGSIESEMVFTDENSNIDELINLPPNGSLSLFATIELNPDGKPSNNVLNFVNTRDPFEISIGLTVPILIKGSFFNYIDTLKISNLDILKSVKRAELIFRTNNNVPLQVNLTVVPFDTISNSPIGDDLFVTLLEPAATDEIGNAIHATEAENKLIIEGENMLNLRRSNALLIKAYFISPGNGAKPAKIKNDNGFDINIILNVSPDL